MASLFKIVQRTNESIVGVQVEQVMLTDRFVWIFVKQSPKASADELISALTPIFAKYEDHVTGISEPVKIDYKWEVVEKKLVEFTQDEVSTLKEVLRMATKYAAWEPEDEKLIEQIERKLR